MSQARIVRIVTTSLATLEDAAPPFNLRHPEPRANLELGLSLLHAAGAQHADLVCLPEGFVAAGIPWDRITSTAEPLSGPTFHAVAECAKQHAMYVVAGFYALAGDRIFNVAALIDRQGRLVGTYAKRHPTESEIAGGITPGAAAAVYPTDFGRVGLAICFDVNWPSHWASLAQQHADVVCWLSAYEGGFPLQAYAWTHRYRIVTSVWPYHARVIDLTGRILASTSRWGRLAVSDVNLDKRLFHTDGQSQHLLAIQTRYGPLIRVETFTEEHLFTLECATPDLSITEVVAQFGLVDYETYLQRCDGAQIRTRHDFP